MLLFGGESLVELLAPQDGEKILDLGCGTGELTERIAQSRACVRGIDSSCSMIAAAQVNYPDINFSVADARIFQVEKPLDAVFSHEVLHWIKEPDAVINCVEQALKPGGRFVAEFNCEGHVGAIVGAHLSVALSKISSGQKPEALNPWYCPSIDEYTGLLKQHGFDVREAVVERQTRRLEGGWLGMVSLIERLFADEFLSRLSDRVRSQVINSVKERLPLALDRDGNYIADYRTIRVFAIKNSSR
ncbi:Trans-aconitate 2-methyltransferase [Microcoleus sp. IPMA8]|uniref:Trans-aconitate 2-methyltransferase n=2 Tax=Microcoleus TaxID=44471 RepID=A0ABX2CY39_9CYAN|nr:Trans-aconitate 2-methyltransferase [Microcoleus asticus IPMA8]